MSHNLALNYDTAPDRSELPHQQQQYVVKGNDVLRKTGYPSKQESKREGEAPVDRNASQTSIPHWAAWFFAGGNTLALAGLIALCFLQNSNFLLVIAAGLLMAANGLRASERTIPDVQ
jgi:hypothetical protein